MKTISGYSSRLPSLNRVLDKWIEANSSIVKSWSAARDVPWWYNERASLSILAGAAFMAGGLAFEEFISDKRKTGKRKRKSNPYMGRTDIYLKLGKSEFIGEAKQCWSGATAKSSNPMTYIKKKLSAACADIRRTKPFGQRRLGILFAMPYIKTNSIDDINERITSWVDMVKDVDCSCCAWVFPAEARYAQYGCEENLCPGAALLIREI